MILKSTHIDSGTSIILFDVTGKPIQGSDAKGAETLSAYDVLQRPIFVWANDQTGEAISLRQVMEYGESAGLSNPENENLKGQLYKHYDEAGLVENTNFDFKGNLLTNIRQVIKDSELLSIFGGSTIDCYRVDWTSFPNILDTQVFETTNEYDALNRITKMKYPEDVENERKELTPHYNRAGALESVKMDGNDYVNHIAYNAKGQRLLIAFENNIMSRYVYDNRTFRLQRQRSEKYIKSDWTYTPNNNVKQDTAYVYDLIGNIVSSKEAHVFECGIGGADTLEKAFNYDPLYRLLQANGRENSPTQSPFWDDSYRSPNNETTTAYTQHYKYDKLGNILKLQHIGNNNFTRDFNYNSSNNKLSSFEVGANNYAYGYDNCGNQISETANRHFEWDAANRMRSFYVEASGSTTQYTQYLYDAGGNRIKKLTWKTGGNYKSTTYIDGAFEFTTDGTEEQNTLHIMDDQSRIATVRLGYDFGDTKPAIQYCIENYLGSSVFLLASNGANINKQEYYPFGETSFGSYAKKRYQYTGKERDEESGLCYYGARYYAAWTCRFISVDPLAGKYPDLSTYLYAYNNPINMNDPTGMEGEKASASSSADNISSDGGGDTASTDGGGGAGNFDGGDTTETDKGITLPEIEVHGEDLSEKVSPIDVFDQSDILDNRDIQRPNDSQAIKKGDIFLDENGTGHTTSFDEFVVEGSFGKKNEKVTSKDPGYDSFEYKEEKGMFDTFKNWFGDLLKDRFGWELVDRNPTMIKNKIEKSNTESDSLKTKELNVIMVFIIDSTRTDSAIWLQTNFKDTISQPTKESMKIIQYYQNRNKITNNKDSVIYK